MADLNLCRVCLFHECGDRHCGKADCPEPPRPPSNKELVSVAHAAGRAAGIEEAAKCAEMHPRADGEFIAEIIRKLADAPITKEA